MKRLPISLFSLLATGVALAQLADNPVTASGLHVADKEWVTTNFSTATNVTHLGGILATNWATDAEVAVGLATKSATNHTHSGVYQPAGSYATGTQGSHADTAYGWGNHATNGYLKTYAETDPVATAAVTNYLPLAGGKSITGDFTLWYAQMKIVSGSIDAGWGYITNAHFAGTGSNLTDVAAETLDGEHGSYYRDGANITNAPWALAASSGVTNATGSGILTLGRSGNIITGAVTVASVQGIAQKMGFENQAWSITNTVPTTCGVAAGVGQISALPCNGDGVPEIIMRGTNDTQVTITQDGGNLYVNGTNVLSAGVESDPVWSAVSNVVAAGAAAGATALQPSGNAGSLTNIPAANLTGQIANGVTIHDATATNQPVTLAQLQAAANVYRTWQLWSGSNSTVLAGAKALRTLDYGNPPTPNLNTVTVNSNSQYITYCSPAAGLTEMKSGLWQVNATMYRSTVGADAVSVAAEIYTRTAGGVETELTPVSGTAAQVVIGSALEYIYTLNVVSNHSMSATDSVILRFKTSAVGGAPVTLYIGAGFLSAPIPSTQFQLADADLTKLASNNGGSLTNVNAATLGGSAQSSVTYTNAYLTREATYTVSGTGTQQVNLAWSRTSQVWRVRITSTNAALVRLNPTNFPGDGYGGEMRLFVANTNSRPIVWEGTIYCASNNTFTTTAPILGKFGMLGIWENFGKRFRTRAVTNSTEITTP